MKIIKKMSALLLALAILITGLSLTPAVTAEAASGKWVAAWGTSIVNSAVSVAGMNLQDLIPARRTIRIEFQVTTGGSRLRLKFSNQYGSAPLTISEASIARTAGGGTADIKDGTQLPITFEGKSSVAIPNGDTVWSDNIDMTTTALEMLSVSLYFANTTYITSAGLSNAQTFMTRPSLSKNSSQVNSASLSAAEVTIGSGTITYKTTPFLCEVDTYSSEPGACSAVFIGDSTLVNTTYLHFAEKLVNNGTKNIGVINEAIIGNKLLSGGAGLIGNLYGDALLDRFKRDVLDIAGVKYVFVKIGLNDILHQYTKSIAAYTAKYSAQDIINGYKKLCEIAHSKNIKVYFFTKSAWKGYERSFLGQKGDLTWTQEEQDICDELNAWIKNNDYIDGYIDCSPLSNPADPAALCPSFTLDGAHLTDLASIALADLIPTSYVGVNNAAKTAAQINKVNPYTEKERIIYNMNHPSTTAAATEPTEPDSSAAPADTQTEAPTATQPEESVTVPDYTQTSETVTTPVIPVINGGYETEEYTPSNVNVNYEITDDMPASIGNGSAIVFILIMILVLVGAAVVVFLSLSKKREREREFE